MNLNNQQLEAKILKNRIVRIVLTGGPCGGKTSALAHLKENLEELGWIVLIVPEMATMCKTAGITPLNGIVSGMLFQESIVNLSVAIEKRFLEVASQIDKGKGVVIIYDRGIPDGRAYCTEEQYLGFLQGENLNIVSARDERYDAVIHLVSAAVGVEDSYTLANNAARSEGIDEAKALDKRTQAAWVGHPHLRVVDTSTDFQGKLNRVFREVCAVLGIPVPVECERKFLVEFNPERIPEGAQRIEIEQVYLASGNDSEIRVRRRGQNGNFTYYLTEKSDHGPGKRLEIERIISEGEFNFASTMMKKGTIPVQKTRICFLHSSQYFELDLFKDAHGNYFHENQGLLEIELTDPEKEVVFPDWISVIREVTDQKEFFNAEIAKVMSRGEKPF